MVTGNPNAAAPPTPGDAPRTADGVVQVTQATINFYGLSHKSAIVPEIVKHAEQKKSTLNFNRGVSGRGLAFFEQEHMAHLHRLATGYPEIDFVGEGLLAPPGAHA